MKLRSASKRLIKIAAFALVLSTGLYLGTRYAAPLEKAPSVAYTLLDGKASNIDQLRGKVVLVNFWATSCTTCVREMPEIAATHEKFKARGYDTLAVAMQYDRPEYVTNFAQTRKLPFDVAFDANGDVAQRFGKIQLTPTSVLINKQGEVVKRYVGVPDFAAMHQLIEKLL
jgi:peroxiredoxin